MPLFAFVLIAALFTVPASQAFAGGDIAPAPVQMAEDSSGTHTHDDDSATDAMIPDDALPDLTMRPKREKPEPPGPPPPIQRDISALPEPVRATRDTLMSAARSGDIEALRGSIVGGSDGTMLSLSTMEEDPIELLRQSSGDDEGFEILAILLEVLEAGYVHVGIGTDDEMYIWPYFMLWPLDSLSDENRVELFRLLTAGDVQDSEQFGSYIFYRVGIRPDGEWRFFVAGD